MPSWRAETRGPDGPPPCARSVDAPAYLQGELRPGERASFESHLEECPSCRDEIRETEDLLDRLRAAPRYPGEVDLLPRILERTARIKPAARMRRARRILAWSSFATAVAVLAAGVYWRLRDAGRQGSGDGGDPAVTAAAGRGTSGEVERAVDRALDWLVRAQEPSGGWSASRWGGQGSYDVGVTGMAAMALLGDRPPGQEDGRRPLPDPGPALSRALMFLLREQTDDGRIGPDFQRSLYNHAIATVALLEAFDRFRLEDLREPIHRAIIYLQRTQSSQGGWGYAGSPSPEPNTALTCWPLQALLLARGLGFGGLDESIRGGFRHIERVADGSGRLGYSRSGDFLYGPETVSIMGAFCALLARDASPMPAAVRSRLIDGVLRARAGEKTGRDLYHDLFLGSALGVLPKDLRGRRPHAANLALAGLQVREGEDRGSWELRDPWGAAGGRIYTTAIAALILQAERRGQWLARFTAKG